MTTNGEIIQEESSLMNYRWNRQPSSPPISEQKSLELAYLELGLFMRRHMPIQLPELEKLPLATKHGALKPRRTGETIEIN